MIEKEKEKEKEEDEQQQQQQQQNEYDWVYEESPLIINYFQTLQLEMAYIYNQSLTTNTKNILNI
jgi:hypothetical protein